MLNEIKCSRQFKFLLQKQVFSILKLNKDKINILCFLIHATNLDSKVVVSSYKIVSMSVGNLGSILDNTLGMAKQVIFICLILLLLNMKEDFNSNSCDF